jgi:hypothetical protein
VPRDFAGQPFGPIRGSPNRRGQHRERLFGFAEISGCHRFGRPVERQFFICGIERRGVAKTGDRLFRQSRATSMFRGYLPRFDAIRCPRERDLDCFTRAIELAGRQPLLGHRNRAVLPPARHKPKSNRNKGHQDDESNERFSAKAPTFLESIQKITHAFTRIQQGAETRNAAPTSL